MISDIFHLVFPYFSFVGSNPRISALRQKKTSHKKKLEDLANLTLLHVLSIFLRKGSGNADANEKQKGSIPHR